MKMRSLIVPFPAMLASCIGLFIAFVAMFSIDTDINTTSVAEFRTRVPELPEKEIACEVERDKFDVLEVNCEIKTGEEAQP